MRQETGERAETYLRLLAEAALRARAASPARGAGADAVTLAAGRVSRAADILIAAVLAATVHPAPVGGARS